MAHQSDRSNWQYISVMLKIVLIFMVVSKHPCHAVVMPPRLNIDEPDTIKIDPKTVLHKDVPYVISIEEGESIDLEINSNSSFTLNLNRAVPVDVTVSISVLAKEDIIQFNQTKITNSIVNSLASNTYSITYPANSFGDRVVNFYTEKLAGHANIVCKVLKQPPNIILDDSSAYISVNVSKTSVLIIITHIVGWIYFFAWSISFYFQVILNYKRQSVIGLNFDFLALNLLGFACYSVYNFTLLFSKSAQQEYYKRYAYSRIPVEYNDLFFAMHAFIITLVTVLQCYTYERGEQRVSYPAALFVTSSVTIGAILTVCSAITKVNLSILDVVLYLSYVKLTITLIKYVPQAFMNYRRKATTGWSIHNILLDFTGGTFSILQMFIIAYNYNDWVSIFGNFTKFGLGVVSMTFDIVFVLQHYVLYGKQENLEDSSESIPSPVISNSIRSASNVRISTNNVEANKSDDSDLED